MNCEAVRERLRDRERGRLAPDEARAVEAHLAECEACRRADAADRALGAVLAERMARHAAPDSLRRKLAARYAPPRRRLIAPVASALLAAAIVLVAVRLVRPEFLRPPPGAGELIDEAVNDHLRVVQAAQPVEIASGGIHQVKPWFTGRVDFAPRVASSGDEEFPLVGGAVGWFRDRKAAVMVWKRRLHTISLLVFRADGLPWPAAGLRPLGRLRVAAAEARGFSVLLWRDGDLGYALVSDVSRGELETLAARVDP
jgi:anti-sigma factor RsiW